MFSWLKGGPKDRSGSEFLDPMSTVFYSKRVNITSCGKRCQGSRERSFSWIFQVSAKCSHLHPSSRDESRVNPTQWGDDVELEQRQRDAHKSGMLAVGRPRRGEREGGRVDASAVDTWPPERGRVLSSVLGPQFTVTCYNSSP